MILALSRAALRDLRDVRAFISQDDPEAAEAVASKLDKALWLIAANPGIGRRVTGQPVREWSVPGLPYLIPYRVFDRAVLILRVFHTARERPSRW